MSTPVDERPAPQFDQDRNDRREPVDGISPVSDDDTYVNSSGNGNHLTVDSSMEPDTAPPRSPSAVREQRMRFEDDLALLEAERVASRSTQEEHEDGDKKSTGSRRGSQPHIDEFDQATSPLHERAAIYNPPENPTTSFAIFIKKLHNSSFIVRYLTYILPVVILLLIPLLVGLLAFPEANVGGVKLLWFAVWLEIVWLTLWAGRIVAKCIPVPLGIVVSIFTNNAKKWRDLAKQLELHASLFFWWLGVEISFLPTMRNHHVNGDGTTREWENTANKVIITFFVWTVINLIEKFLIQLIAISFHLRTYADRIEINKFQIGSLGKLYAFSTAKITEKDEDFEEKKDSGSGSRTPFQYAKQAQKTAKGALNRVGDVAGAVTADFTGRATNKSTHPHSVVLTLLRTTSGSQVLARRLYRTFVRDGFDTVFAGDLKEAFDDNEEAEAAFAMFDKDLNGDISMEELEAVCMEVGRDRKSITASLKDLDSVVSRLDNVLSFLVFIIVLLVFLSLISTSAAGVLTSAGSTILALSWLFSATAQEFLQSVVFVFIKHPFDVGDRVTIYGNTGENGLGDDYYVKQISLLYTEFKKMQGHIVQAPNSYLNTLFVLNMRRSGALAEVVPIVLKFGTPLSLVDALRLRLLEFVRSERRDYQTNILTEMREVTENFSISLNIVFFYKTNCQNELLRLQRRNKFVCMLMVALEELGIEGPRMNLQGATHNFPVHVRGLGASLQSSPPTHDDGPASPTRVSGNTGDLAEDSATSSARHPSILRKGSDAAAMRARGAAPSRKHVDFSLGVREMTGEDMVGDVFEDRPSPLNPVVREANREARERRMQEVREEEEERRSQSSSRPGRSSNLSVPSNREDESRRSGESGRSISSSIHRSRFFRHRNSVGERPDLEKGK